MKPYKGELVNCTIVRLSKTEGAHKPEKYGPNLGYIISCDFVDHPEFRGFDARGGSTSLVVSMDDEGNVETLNSRYKVIDPLPLEIKDSYYA